MSNYQPACRCPGCGEKFSITSDWRYIEPPSDERPEDMWLLDMVMVMGEALREWTCRHCGVVTNTVEISIDKLHDLTDGSPEKEKFISENFRPENTRWDRRRSVLRSEISRVEPSPELARVVGECYGDERQIISKLWHYIEENKLLDGSVIRADELLRPVFNGDYVSMFDISDVLDRNIRRSDC